jgi:uncharacterized protein HemX
MEYKTDYPPLNYCLFNVFSSAPIISTTSSQSTPTSSTTLSQSTSPSSTPSTSLSTGAKAGLGVGVALGIIGLIAIVGAIWISRRQKAKTTAQPQARVSEQKPELEATNTAPTVIRCGPN